MKPEVASELLATLEKEVQRKARKNFYVFVQYMAHKLLPEGFKDGKHIREICDLLQKVESGEEKRVMIFLPPRSMKSILLKLFQAWCMGRHPKWQLMGISYASSLADSFSREIRNLVMDEDFKKIFPTVRVSEDSYGVKRWRTTHGGIYYPSGITGGIAGKGAHLATIDDPLSEQDAVSETKREFVKNWWPQGLKSRLQPSGRVVIVQTRWHQDDLSGWLLEQDKKSTKSQWTVVKYPAVYFEGEEERSYWPEHWPLKDLLAFRDDPTTPSYQWSALYMQDPVARGGNLFKSEHFKRWTEVNLPKITSVILSMDTAFSSKETADFSCLQVWGLWEGRDVGEKGKEWDVVNTLLLANRRGKWEYPELLGQVKDLTKKYKPDLTIIEKKASGEVLYPDLRRQGFNVRPYIPGKGQDKIARAHAVMRYFVGGRVWIVDNSQSKLLLEEAMAFPYGVNDDQVDAMTLSLLYLRDAWGLRTVDDPEDEVKAPPRKLYW